MSLFRQAKAGREEESPVRIADSSSMRDIRVTAIFGQNRILMTTNDEYPQRDVNLHQAVFHASFQPRRLTMKRSRALRIEGVLVPTVAAAALSDRPDYVRLGVPAYVRALFRKFSGPDDPLYENTDSIWWVRAWPTDALATTITADGTVQKHDAAAILRRTGQGFTVTADLVFDVFYSMRFGSRQMLYYSQGFVVTVARSVISGLHDDRPDPRRRSGVDESTPGAHLPSTRVVSPDVVRAQITALDRGSADNDQAAPADLLARRTEDVALTELLARRTEDAEQPDELPRLDNNHVKMEDTGTAPAARRPGLGAWLQRLHG